LHPMSFYGVGETYRDEFNTYDDTNVLANADATPTGILVVNGTDTGTTVTITNPSTGRYKLSVSLSGLAFGDDFWVYVTATVGGLTQARKFPTYRITSPGPLAAFDGVVNAHAGASLTLSGDHGDGMLRGRILTLPGTGDSGVILTDDQAAAPNRGVTIFPAPDGTIVNGETPYNIDQAAVLSPAALDAIITEVAAGGNPAINARQSLAMTLDAVGAGLITGAGTLSPILKNPDGTVNRIALTVDASNNRTAVTLTPPA
jgi:hypothetical protein